MRSIRCLQLDLWLKRQILSPKWPWSVRRREGSTCVDRTHQIFLHQSYLYGSTNAKQLHAPWKLLGILKKEGSFCQGGNFRNWLQKCISRPPSGKRNFAFSVRKPAKKRKVVFSKCPTVSRVHEVVLEWYFHIHNFDAKTFDAYDQSGLQPNSLFRRRTTY